MWKRWLPGGVALLMAVAAAAGNDRSLVSLATYDSSIVVSMRYLTRNNFVGDKIDGYRSNICLLSRPAVGALAAVQRSLRARQLGLIVYDCYRPQRAVDHFVRWARDLTDTRTKPVYYPAVAKDRLFSDGYIAARSGHSRGSTVDLSVLRCEPGHRHCVELDMGTPWDYFDPRSATASRAVTPQQRANRRLLKSVMEAHGFQNYAREWWHYTLVDEPFPDTYFDVPVATPAPGH